MAAPKSLDTTPRCRGCHLQTVRVQRTWLERLFGVKEAYTCTFCQRRLRLRHRPRTH